MKHHELPKIYLLWYLLNSWVCWSFQAYCSLRIRDGGVNINVNAFLHEVWLHIRLVCVGTFELTVDEYMMEE